MSGHGPGIMTIMTGKKNDLGWKAKTSFLDLISEMMDNDMNIAKTLDKKK